MPEAISTQNLVTLPITSQELGRGAFSPPPNQNRTIKSPATIGIRRHDHISLVQQGPTFKKLLFHTVAENVSYIFDTFHVLGSSFLSF